MKPLIIVSALALLASPAMAGRISDVDHPDVPNCTIVGPNVADCENLTLIALFPPSGQFGHNPIVSGCHDGEVKVDGVSGK